MMPNYVIPIEKHSFPVNHESRATMIEREKHKTKSETNPRLWVPILAMSSLETEWVLPESLCFHL